MKKMKARPRNKPFDAKERQYLCGLDAVDACTEKRITWNQAFIAYAIKELVRGCASKRHLPPGWMRSGSHRQQTHRAMRRTMAQETRKTTGTGEA